MFVRFQSNTDFPSFPLVFFFFLSPVLFLLLLCHSSLNTNILHTQTYIYKSHLFPNQEDTYWRENTIIKEKLLFYRGPNISLLAHVTCCAKVRKKHKATTFILLSLYAVFMLLLLIEPEINSAFHFSWFFILFFSLLLLYIFLFCFFHISFYDCWEMRKSRGGNMNNENLTDFSMKLYNIFHGFYF